MKKKKTEFSAEELALILEVNVKTIKYLAKNKELPCVFINRRPRFNLEKICKHFLKLEGKGDVAS